MNSMLNRRRRVAIIGTRDIKSKHIFELILSDVKNRISSSDILISGGAAGVDHIAVRLYLEKYISDIELHLPCRWKDKKYFDSGEYDWRTNPGKTSNYYHNKFSQILGLNSLNEIDQVLIKGGEIIVHDGFHSRNTGITDCDLLLAYSFELTGGTLNTWIKCKSDRVFINIKNLH